jgi:hypothetical protein
MGMQNMKHLESLPDHDLLVRTASGVDALAVSMDTLRDKGCAKYSEHVGIEADHEARLKVVEESQRSRWGRTFNVVIALIAAGSLVVAVIVAFRH